MLDALKVWWRSILHLNHRGYIYVWGNLLWVVLSLPIVTMPAAWAGLVKMSHAAHHSPTADIHVMWGGFKENIRRGLLLFMLNVAVIGINIANLSAYRDDIGVFVVALRVVWVGALVMWATVQLFMFPLFYEMEKPSLWGAMRNALVMIVLNPFFTVVLWIGIVPIVLLSTAFPAAWLLLTAGLLAVLANNAVFDRLRVVGYKKPLPQDED